MSGHCPDPRLRGGNEVTVDTATRRRFRAIRVELVVPGVGFGVLGLQEDVGPVLGGGRRFLPKSTARRPIRFIGFPLHVLDALSD